MARLRAMATWLAREPLVHFLALGAVIFAVHALLNPAAVSDERRIVVGASDVARLRDLAVQQWGRTPDARQMEDLIGAYVREEVLYRAALAKGLDRDDVIVRRRLAQKMEFLAHEAVRAPDEGELRAYFAEHAARFARPATVDFEQRYFNPERRGAAASADAEAALARLRQGQRAESDNSMLAQRLSAQERATIVRDFGDAVADAVFSLPVGSWSGPTRSNFGVYLLRVVARQPAAAAPFAAVRERVASELLNARVAAARDAAYAKLLAEYSVVLPTQQAALARP